MVDNLEMENSSPVRQESEIGLSNIGSTHNCFKKLSFFSSLNYIVGNSFCFAAYIILLSKNGKTKNANIADLLQLITYSLKWLSMGLNIFIFYFFNHKYNQTLRRVFRYFVYSLIRSVVCFSVFLLFFFFYLQFFTH